MAQQGREDELYRLANWVRAMSEDEMEESLTQLQLKHEGARWEKDHRMMKWLLGDYSAGDFVQTAESDGEPVRIKLERIRATFITTVSQEVSNSTVYDENVEHGEPHPLTMLLESLRADIEGAPTRFEIEVSGEELPQDQNGGRDQDDAPADRNQNRQDEVPEEVQVDNGVAQETEPVGVEAGMERLTRSNSAGTTESQQNDILKVVTQLHQHVLLLSERMDEISSKNSEKPRGPTSSTRIAQTSDVGQALNPDAQPFRQVNFQDTFTFFGMDNSSPANNSLPALQRTIIDQQKKIAELQESLDRQDQQFQQQQTKFQQLLQEQRDQFSRQVDQLRRVSVLQSGQTAGTRPNAPPSNIWGRGVPSSNDSQSNGSYSMGNSRSSEHRDIGQIVRRWNVRFAGEKGESIDLFLTRVDECRILAQLSESDVLASLSELFTGVAATWFRNSKHQWRTWAEFKAAAQKWYGTSRRQQQRLLAEATARTQGEEEPVREYFTCIQAILRRITPPLETGCQIDIMHANMNPDLQCMIPRNGLNEVEVLVEKAIDAELTLEAKRAFRPPPAPETCIMPEAAYKPKQTQQKKKAAAANTDPKVSAVTANPMAEAMKAITEKLDQLIKGSGSKPQNQQQKKGRPANNGNKGQNGASSGPKEADGKAQSNKKKGPIPPEMKCHTCGVAGHL